MPLATVEQTLGTRVIRIPLANFDNNQHTFNENVRIGHLWNAIDSFAALFTMNRVTVGCGTERQQSTA